MKERTYYGIARNRRWQSQIASMTCDNDEEPVYKICLDHGSATIAVALGPTGHYPLEQKIASEILKFSPQFGRYVEGRYVAMLRPQGWFERKCAEAGCSWFVPFVRRMAAGEVVPLEQIQVAYREHNEGKEMPHGTWSSLFLE